MSFPKYPEYKDSGVEWLGEVPAHWEVKRLRYVAELNPSKSEVRSLPAQSSVSFIPMEAVGEDGSLSLEQARPIGEVLAGYTYVREGDVTIAKITPCFENGKGAVMRGLENRVGFGTTELTVMRPVAGLTKSDYLYRVVSSEPFRVLGESSMYGAGGQKRVPDDFVRNFTIGWPPYQEQTEIQDFLDHETARIDALVEKQQRLIELLKEKRQAVISHAVTKGLNPDVPMKDSGVEWLGEVPAHWTVAPIKVFFRFLDGKRIPLKSEDRGGRPGEFPYYGASGIIDWIDDYIFDCDHVLVSEDGANLLARSSPIAFVATGKYWVNNHAHILHPIDDNLNYWAEVIEHLDLSIHITGSAQPKLTSEALGAISVASPPSTCERQKIQKKITEVDGAAKKLITEAVNGIKLLQERRSALISAAVTGKIDVRGWQPPAVSSAPADVTQAEEL